jgi:hypothetical protein
VTVPIVLSYPLSIPEIRVLQEFRRLSAETLPVDKIRNIKHPVDAGEALAPSLVAKGYLTADAAHENFRLTDKSKSFLAIDYKPEQETAGGGDESA